MFNVRINEQGQLTIPEKLRDEAHIGLNDVLQIAITESGDILIRKYDPSMDEEYDEYLEEYCKNAEEQKIDDVEMAQIEAIIAEREQRLADEDWASGEELVTKARARFKEKEENIRRLLDGDK